jgi:hypothetical protein
VAITDDSEVESTETTNLTLSGITGGATLGALNITELSIIDNDVAVPTPGTLQFSSSTYSVNEGDGTASITIQRTDGSDGSVSVTVQSSGVTASALDYTAVSQQTITFADGVTSQSFDVAITDDSEVESTETTNLTLSGITGGATLGALNITELSIIDNDGNTTSEGCFIATAAYGNYFDEEVLVLRQFRDEQLLTRSAGRIFVDLYYEYSPPIADLIRGSTSLKFIVRGLLTPLVWIIEFPVLLMLYFLLLLVRWHRRQVKFV